MKIEDAFIVTIAVLFGVLVLASYAMTHMPIEIDWDWTAIVIAGVLSVYAAELLRHSFFEIRRIFFSG